MAFRPFDPPRESWVVTCKKCGQITVATEKKRGAPPPVENTVVTCHLCGEKRRYRPTEIYAGAPARAFISNNVRIARPRRVAVCFIPGKEGYTVYCLADDLKTCVSPHTRIRKASTLRNMLRYLGATREELAQYDLTMRSWGQGSTWVTLQPGKQNLLKINMEYLP